MSSAARTRQRRAGDEATPTGNRQLIDRVIHFGLPVLLAFATTFLSGLRTDLNKQTTQTEIISSSVANIDKNLTETKEDLGKQLAEAKQHIGRQLTEAKQDRDAIKARIEMRLQQATEDREAIKARIRAIELDQIASGKSILKPSPPQPAPNPTDQ